MATHTNITEHKLKDNKEKTDRYDKDVFAKANKEISSTAGTLICLNIGGLCGLWECAGTLSVPCSARGDGLWLVLILGVS